MVNMRSWPWVVAVLCAFGSSALAADVEMQQRIPPQPAGALVLQGTQSSGKTLDELPVEAPALLSPTDAGTLSNYTFVAMSGAFTPNSGGTRVTTIEADDALSAAIPIGFDFWYMGVRYSQVYASSNGWITFTSGGSSTAGNNLATSAATIRPLVAPLWDDLDGATTGTSRATYLTTGSAGSRVFTFEWLNWEWNYTANAAVISFQVKLYEGSGKVEFVYRQEAAAVVPGTTSGASIGITATGTGSGNFISLADSSAAPPISSTTETTTILTKPATGQSYSFTPPVPLAPTGLNFTAVTQTGMTLNWTDNATNEVGDAIYRSTDNVTFSYVAQAGANATSYAMTGLLPGTTYYFKVIAVTEGGLSGAATGTQATLPAGEIGCNGAGGNWSATTTWSGGVLPGSGDNVTIGDGCTVTIDTAATINKLTVGGGASGVLQFEATTARTLTVNTSATVSAGGTFQSAASGTVTTHLLSIGTDLVNNGTLDFSTNANTAGVELRFVNQAHNTFSGTGTTTDLRLLSLSKGTLGTILDITVPFTVRGAASSDTVGFLSASPYTGTLKLSGTGTYSSVVFLTTAYSIPTTGGFWLNNPNFTVAGMNGSPTLNGALRVSNGTFNIGTSSGNSMAFGTGSTVTIEGGAVNATGRFGVSGTSTSMSYTQTAGVVTVCTIGNASTTQGCFDLGTSTTTSFTMGGGSIVVQLPCSGSSGPKDYRAAVGLYNITGGTLQFGNAASGAAKTYYLTGGSVSSIYPNLVIDNTYAHTVFLQTVGAMGLTATVKPTTTLNLNGVTLTVIGTLTNDGTITGTTTSSRLYFGGSSAQAWNGAGTVTTPLDGMSIDNLAGVTINAPAFTTLRVNLFRGLLVNSNRVTLGNGGTTSAVTQIGSTGLGTPGGNFDLAPVFNIGSGGYQVLYQPESVARTTGLEIPSTRSVYGISINNPFNVTLAGGPLTLTNVFTLTAGTLVTTPTNLLVLGSGVTSPPTGSATSYVNGPLALEVNSAANVTNKYFAIGSAAGWRPVVLSNFHSNGALQRYTAQVIDGATAGAPVAPLVWLNPARYVRIDNTANVFSTTTATVQLSYGADDSLGTIATARVAQSSAVNGNYFSLGGTNTTSPTTGIVSATALTPGNGYFVLANEALPPMPPSNDECAGAIAVPAGGPFPYTTTPVDVTAATTTGDPAFCATTSHTIWYTFTPSVTASYTISTCQATAPGTTATDTVLGVFSGASCGSALNTVACNDNDSACSGGTSRSTVSATLVAGTTYYINVGTAGTTTPSPANIQLSIQQFLPPANDSCAAPVPLALEIPVQGTTAYAIDDYELTGGSCFTSQGQLTNTASTAPGRDVVYSFTAPADGKYSIRVTNYTGGNPVLYTTSACPAATPPTPLVVSTCISAANRTTSTAEEVMCQAMSAGQVVYAIVDEFAAAGGTFTIEANACDQESASNDTPATANPLACGKEGVISAGDYDYYTLPSPAAGWRTFAMIDAIASISSDTRLRLSNGIDVYEFDDDDGDAAFGASGYESVIAGGVTPSGSTYLSVGGYSSTTVIEPYRLYAAVEPPIANATAEVEPNDTAATAGTAGNNYFKGTLSASTDVDYYAFTANAGELVMVGLDGDANRDGTALDGTVALLAGDGTTALVTVNGSGTSVTATPNPGVGLTATTPAFPGEGLVYRIRTSGTYYVKVTGTPGSGASGQDYLLAITRNCAMPPADLDVTQVASSGSVNSGAEITYTVTVTNNGPNVAYGATLTDVVPANMTFVSVTPPAGWTCTAPVSGSYQCTTEALAAASPAVFTIVDRANDCTGNLTTTHAVTVSSSAPDGNPSNNASSIQTDIVDPGTCDDRNACTTDDHCSGGVCVGSPRDCSDGNLCTTDSCNAASGQCEYTTVTCNDNNACTDDSCNPVSGCVFTANDASPCDDGSLCTLNDHCSGGSCVGTAPNCDDGNVCTTDGCDPATGGCTHVNNTNPCDDLNACTTNDQCAPQAAQAFDGVTAPALPAGWTTTLVTGQAGDIAFKTVVDYSDTAPNAAFTDDPSHITDKVLDSPAIAILTDTAHLTFRHRFDLESGYDGAVLEISIAGGAFQDFETAGGTFVTGGYTHTISTSYSSPIAGRKAWSSTTSGFVTATGLLPPSAAGQSVVLRWRVATDTSTSKTGYWVDSIIVTDPGESFTCHGGPAVSCDDSNVCTVDTCSPQTGCSNLPGNPGTLCRASQSACDPAEYCTGNNVECPPNVVERSNPVGATVRLTHSAPVTTIAWTEAEPGPFNIYRGTATLLWTYNQSCFSPGVTGSSVTDTEAVPAAFARFYLVSRHTSTCIESSLGQASDGSDIPNGSPCP